VASTAAVLTGAAVWLILAVIVGAAGLVAALAPPFPQLVLAGLTVGLLLLGWAWPPFGRWAMTVDPRVLLLFHATRLVGFYFLHLHARGELPWAFAVPGGWGDVAAAVLALGVAAGAPRSRLALAAFTLVGLPDILYVVATAARLALADPGAMRALTVLPLSLLITFVVPIVIWSHLILLARVARGAPGRGPAT
jgi:hypothetical protein